MFTQFQLALDGAQDDNKSLRLLKMKKWPTKMEKELINEHRIIVSYMKLVENRGNDEAILPSFWSFVKLFFPGRAACMMHTGSETPTDNCILFNTGQTICGQREILVEKEREKKEEEESRKCDIRVDADSILHGCRLYTHNLKRKDFRLEQ